MKAIGSYIFAGGFTIGVKKHFDVLAHFEGDGAYGADTFSLNYPDIPVYSGPDEWPTGEYKDIDFVYGNPPCAPWSTLGSGSKGADGWKTDPRVSCWNDVFSLIYTIKPKAIAIESVPRAYSKTGGLPMIQDFTEKANKEGYAVTHLMVDGQYTGLNHTRRRFFFLAHKGHFNPPAPNWNPAPNVGEVLDEFTAEYGNDPGHYGKLSDNEMNLVKIAKPGESLRNIWESLNPPETWKRSTKGRKGVIGRPQFMKWRLTREQTMGVIAGGFAIHPEEDRLLGIRELCAFSGYPVDYKFAGAKSGWPSLIARGVMPPVGEWLARNVKSMIEAESKYEINSQFIDYRKPSTGDLFNA